MRRPDKKKKGKRRHTPRNVCLRCRGRGQISTGLLSDVEDCADCGGRGRGTPSMPIEHRYKRSDEKRLREYEEHLEALCHRHGLKVVWGRSGGSGLPPGSIGLFRIRSHGSYALALHALGKVAERTKGSKLAREVKAWAWAKRHALQWRPSMSRAMQRKVGFVAFHGGPAFHFLSSPTKAHHRSIPATAAEAVAEAMQLLGCPPERDVSGE